MLRHPSFGPPGASALPALGLVLCVIAVTPAAADVVHLKNGASIVAETIEEKGDDLVIKQRGGTIVVPRAQVERIERDAAAGPETPPAAGTESTAGSGGAGAGGATAARPAPSSREDILQRIEVLDRRIRDFPLTRAENTRQVVALLDLLGTQAYKGRDYDEALARFRQALGYDAHDVRAQLGLAATHVSRGEDIYARATLEKAILDHPNEPALLALLGDVYSNQERPEDALAAWEKSYALSPDPLVKARLDKLRREHTIDGDYRLSEAAHFTLKYDGERAGPDLGGEIVSYLEARFTDLVNRFDFYPAQAIVVILYPSREFYAATLAESNVGGLFDGKIRVPIGGLQQLNPEARRVLVHELAHAFIAGKSGGTCPRWLHEGLAQQIEGRETPAATGVSLAREYDALKGQAGWGESFSYPSALSFVEFLVEREGFPHLVDILAAMASGASQEAAFEQVTHYSLKELREAWGQALARKYLK
ncbi:MAG TPA: tetratricopeptide repeat protein [Candidatus Polarisedimenticolia bacterium]|nr:tetratricopeptide repeat protein [Candidatus Polarisedimenticolia bacterium]